MAVTKAQIHTLISYYLNAYGVKYEGKPKDFNRFRDQWAFQGLIEDYGMDRSKKIIDYYFDTKRPGHPTNYFVYNYEKISQIMLEKEHDEKVRAELRAESRKRVEEWRKKNEQH